MGCRSAGTTQTPYLLAALAGPMGAAGAVVAVAAEGAAAAGGGMGVAAGVAAGSSSPGVLLRGLGDASGTVLGGLFIFSNGV